MQSHSPGKKFKLALEQENPLQIIGVINAYVGIMAKEMGYKALYVSGAGVANSSYGLPDLGITTLNNVLEDVNRLTSAVDIPILVDIDTGWGNSLMIERTIKSMIRAGAAAIHIEDQTVNKRCGHRPNKSIVPVEEMLDRLKAAINAKVDPDFIIMARTDAYSNEGLEKMIERAIAYQDAGADMLFPEALGSLDEYAQLKKAVKIPILANLTEFGKTPLFSKEELAKAGIDMALYPLSVNRSMNLAAYKTLKSIREKGTQMDCIHEMQTRNELYHFLKYLEQEEKFNK